MGLGNPEATMEHGHQALAKMLSAHEQPLEPSTFDQLSMFNHGVVFHRYPYPITRNMTDLPTMREWLLKPDSIDLSKVNETVLFTLQFLNRNQVMKSKDFEALKEAMSCLGKTPDIIQKNVTQDSKGLELPRNLNNQFNQLLESSEKAMNCLKNDNTGLGKDSHEILSNFHYHLKGLKDNLDCMSQFPDASYTLLFGDSILMHLQHLDELMEAYLYLRLHQSRLRIHDLELYRNLRGHKEDATLSSVVASMNCSYGDHYPYRYRLIHAMRQEQRELPGSIICRFDALQISLNADQFDQGYTPVDVDNNNKRFFKPGDLQEHLLETSAQVVSMLVGRFPQ
jgi:hypothetical protein